MTLYSSECNPPETLQTSDLKKMLFPKTILHPIMCIGVPESLLLSQEKNSILVLYPHVMLTTLKEHWFLARSWPLSQSSECAISGTSLNPGQSRMPSAATGPSGRDFREMGGYLLQICRVKGTPRQTKQPITPEYFQLPQESFSFFPFIYLLTYYSCTWSTL